MNRLATFLFVSIGFFLVPSTSIATEQSTLTATEKWVAHAIKGKEILQRNGRYVADTIRDIGPTIRDIGPAVGAAGGKQVLKKGGTALAAGTAGATLGPVIAVGGVLYTGYELYKYLRD